jgi:hypothetical protein
VVAEGCESTCRKMHCEFDIGAALTPGLGRHPGLPWREELDHILANAFAGHIVNVVFEHQLCNRPLTRSNPPNTGGVRGSNLSHLLSDEANTRRTSCRWWGGQTGTTLLSHV